MAAQVVADELKMPILLINYSQIESKFVGVAVKRLGKAFQSARDHNAVLFFDEADSFLGKRIEDVRSSSDQSVNSLRSEMLILLEQFSGVVIFATNLVKNFDSAFETRILAHIQFELPNHAARQQIIRSKIPRKAPVSIDVDQTFIVHLADITEGFSGREIKTSVLAALTHAAIIEKVEITSQDFIYAFEKQKAMILNLHKKTADNSSSDRSLGSEIKQEIATDTNDAIR